MRKTSPKHVILFHGRNQDPVSKGGGPNSEKLKAIADEARVLGMEPHIANHRATNLPDERVRMAREQYGKLLREGGVILVGNSMGGYVATVLACEFSVDGLFLMAPAFFKPEYAIQSFPVRTEKIFILQGTGDEGFVENSRKFSRAVKGVSLVEVDDGHRLETQIPTLPGRFRSFFNDVCGSPVVGA